MAKALLGAASIPFTKATEGLGALRQAKNRVDERIREQRALRVLEKGVDTGDGLSGGGGDGLSEGSGPEKDSELLVERGLMLLGLSGDLSEGDPRKVELSEDAASAFRMAAEVREAEQRAKGGAATQMARDFLSELSDKYEGAGGALVDESRELWANLKDSDEAKGFIGSVMAVLNDGRRLAAGSAEGQLLLSAIEGGGGATKTLLTERLR
jgi:hypothetical protein